MKKENDVFDDLLDALVVVMIAVAVWDQLRTNAEVRRATAIQIASENARLALTEAAIANAEAAKTLIVADAEEAATRMKGDLSTRKAPAPRRKT